MALGGVAGRYDEVQQAATDASNGTRYTADDMKAVAEQLTERGVPFERLAQSMKVAGDAAAALKKPIGEVADQIAITFGGKVPRDLEHAVPALRNLTAEALQSGAALDVLEQRFGGHALADALTPTGREAAAVKQYNEAWKEFGKTLIPIEQEYLPKIAAAATTAIKALSGLTANNGAGAAAGFLNQQLSILNSIGSVVLPRQASAVLSGAITAQQASFTAQAKAPADQSAAKQLADDGRAAREQIEQLRQVDRQAAADNSAAQLGEVAKQVAEEVKLRKAGVDQLIGAIDQRQAAELKPLNEAVSTAQDQRAHTEQTADDQRDVGQAAYNRGDLPAYNAASVAEAKARTEVRDLDEQIRTLRQQIAAVTQKTADDEARAVDDAAKQTGEDASKARDLLRRQMEGAAESSNGNPLAFYAAGAAAADQYRQAIAAADQQLDALIAKATDPAEIERLKAEKIEIDVDAVHTLEQVHTLAGDIHEALQDPLAGAFDRMLETQGSLSDRLKAGERAFLESIVKMLAPTMRPRWPRTPC